MMNQVVPTAPRTMITAATAATTTHTTFEVPGLPRLPLLPRLTGVGVGVEPLLLAEPLRLAEPLLLAVALRPQVSRRNHRGLALIPEGGRQLLQHLFGHRRRRGVIELTAVPDAASGVPQNGACVPQLRDFRGILAPDELIRRSSSAARVAGSAERSSPRDAHRSMPDMVFS
ncbi:hypothetical protein [Corynebacterium variabile]|uniref:hypothetical protein n=1 Tax=Corynebacterium variabile TaxID=1727 RepID=UPI0028D91104|nr:hypothetical protein [Corynebacterium variabile]